MILTSEGKDLTPVNRNKVNSELKSARKLKVRPSPRSTNLFIGSEDRKSGHQPEEALGSLVQCWTYCEGEFMQKKPEDKKCSFLFLFVFFWFILYLQLSRKGVGRAICVVYTSCSYFSLSWLMQGS